MAQIYLFLNIDRPTKTLVIFPLNNINDSFTQGFYLTLTVIFVSFIQQRDGH